MAQVEQMAVTEKGRVIDREALERELERSLRETESRLRELCDALGQSLDSDVNLDTQDGTTASMETVCTAYGKIDLDPLEEANASVTRLGVVGVSPRILALAERVNEAKLAMKTVWARAQTVKYPALSVTDGMTQHRVPLPRLVMRRIGRAQLNLMAAYRKVPILPKRPVRVVFASVLTRSVYHKSRDQLIEMLSRTKTTFAEADLAKLHDHPDLTEAAIVGKRYANFRANVWYAGLDPNGRGRVQIRAELPILYPIGRCRTAPVVVYPPPGAATRSEAELRERKAGVQSEPFLESIGAHRYAAE